MKTSLASKTNPESITYNGDLDKLENLDLFPIKTATAKATLLKAPLPSRGRSVLSSLKK